MNLPTVFSKKLSTKHIQVVGEVWDKFKSHKNNQYEYDKKHKEEMSRIEGDHYISLADIKAQYDVMMKRLNNIERNNERKHSQSDKLIHLMENLSESKDPNASHKMEYIVSAFKAISENNNQIGDL